MKCLVIMLAAKCNDTCVMSWVYVCVPGCMSVRDSNKIVNVCLYARQFQFSKCKREGVNERDKTNKKQKQQKTKNLQRKQNQRK